MCWILSIYYFLLNRMSDLKLSFFHVLFTNPLFGWLITLMYAGVLLLCYFSYEPAPKHFIRRSHCGWPLATSFCLRGQFMAKMSCKVNQTLWWLYSICLCESSLTVMSSILVVYKVSPLEVTCCSIVQQTFGPLKRQIDIKGHIQWSLCFHTTVSPDLCSSDDFWFIILQKCI